jgi:hypothetical protein
MKMLLWRFVDKIDGVIRDVTSKLIWNIDAAPGASGPPAPASRFLCSANWPPQRGNDGPTIAAIANYHHTESSRQAGIFVELGAGFDDDKKTRKENKKQQNREQAERSSDEKLRGGPGQPNEVRRVGKRRQPALVYAAAVE